MRRLAFALFACVLATEAAAADVKSVYTTIDLKACKQTEKPDGFVFEGSWRCKGLGGYDVLVSAADARDMVGFGKSLEKNCAGHRTFGGFNSAGGTVEWRLRDGKPFATILRWTVNADAEHPDKQISWLVVSKLESSNSCHMHYVSGSWPNANEQARKIADDKAQSFVCKTSVPGFDSTVGEPGISLEPCTDD